MRSLCMKCKMRMLAEKKPDSLWARVWKWHTRWRPSWKAYEKGMDQKQNAKTP